MSEIIDVYEKHLSFPTPGVYGSDLSALGYSIDEMKELLVSEEVSYRVFNSENDYIILPREGDFYAFPFEKFTSKVGPCYLMRNPWSLEFHIMFDLRIFNEQGYLIVENRVTTYFSYEEQDAKVAFDDPKMEKYWNIIAEKFYKRSMQVPK